ncbi:MAG: hypothetical protein ACPGXK_11080 [Phycisphaerae bacterium]
MELSSSPAVVVFEDVLCRYCGYNLRGLPIDGRCPECNADVNQSFHTDLLRYANVDWLRRIKFGIDLMIVGFLLGVVLGFFGGIAVVAAGGGVAGGGILVFQLALTLASSLVNLISILMITSQEPRESMSEQTDSWRRIARGAAIAGFVLQGLVAIATNLQVASVGAQVAFIGLSGIAGVVMTFAIASHTQLLAARIPNDSMVSSINVVKWGLSIVGLIGGLIGVLSFASMFTTGFGGAPAAPNTTFTVMMGITAIGGCATGLGSWVFGIWALILVFKFRSALRKAIHLQHAGPSYA